MYPNGAICLHGYRCFNQITLLKPEKVQKQTSHNYFSLNII